MTRETEYYKAINWNAIEDVVDKATWEKLTEQFWLDTRIPLSNDLDDWRRLSDKEREKLRLDQKEWEKKVNTEPKEKKLEKTEKRAIEMARRYDKIHKK